MRKIYIVWQGEYEDTCAIAAFSRKKDAEKYANLKTELEEDIIGSCYVTSMEVDTNIITGDLKVCIYYSARVWLDSNEDHKAGDLADEYDNPYGEKQVYTEDSYCRTFDCNDYLKDAQPDRYIETWSCISYEHAKETAWNEFNKVKENEKENN